MRLTCSPLASSGRGSTQWKAFPPRPPSSQRMLAAGYPEVEAEAVTTLALAAFADTVEPEGEEGRTDD